MGGEQAGDGLHEPLDTVYRSESRRIHAILIRLLGEVEVAEQALLDAFRAALEQWPRDGRPLQSYRLPPPPCSL